jgi:cobalt-zinc-cadmium efflux system membrane fusion protein
MNRYGSRGARPRAVWLLGGLVVLAVVLAVLAAGPLRAAVRRWQRAESPKETAGILAPSPDPNVMTVDDGQLQRMRLEQVQVRPFQIERSAVGRIAFNDDHTTPVFTAYAGRVVRLLAGPGDDVRPGSPLAQIDTPDLVQADNDFINAGSGLRKARNQMELARRVAARDADLFAVQAIAAKDLEQAQSDLRNAEHDLQAAEGTYAAMRDRLRVFGKTDADATLLEERRQVDPHMVLAAPIAGTVTARKVGPGQYVKPDNPDPLFSIADLSTMWLLANVSEADISLVHAGQLVEVQVAAYPGELFRARITNIGAAVDPVTRRVSVRAEIANPGRKLKPDMFASFRILTGTSVQSAAVPTTAVVRDGEQAAIWVVSEPHRLTRRAVTLGTEQAGVVQVLTGVQPGEQVVVDGGIFLSNAEQTVARTGRKATAKPD